MLQINTYVVTIHYQNNLRFGVLILYMHVLRTPQSMYKIIKQNNYLSYTVVGSNCSSWFSIVRHTLHAAGSRFHSELGLAMESIHLDTICYIYIHSQNRNVVVTKRTYAVSVEC